MRASVGRSRYGCLEGTVTYPWSPAMAMSSVSESGKKIVSAFRY